jgi:hypothetical protein
MNYQGKAAKRWTTYNIIGDGAFGQKKKLVEQNKKKELT